MTSELFSIIAPVFVCAIIGFAWSKKGIAFPTDTLRPLIVYLGAPCLVFSSLTTTGISASSIGFMSAMAVLVIAASAAASFVILYFSGMSIRAYLPALMFPNAGNMGLPLTLFAFGQEGLALGVAYYLAMAIGQFTIGMGIAAGSMSWKNISRSAIIYALIAALAFVMTDTIPPKWLTNTTDLIGGLAIPLLLIILGHSLGGLKVHHLKKSIWLSALKLSMGFALGFGLAEAFSLEGVERGVLILQSAMPVAVFSFLFAAQYKTEPDDVAGMVVVSTAMSFISLPILLWYVLG
jgi:hypothetical protein